MTGYSILHSESSNGWGGQEIRVFQEMLAMHARGHQVWMATPRCTTIFKKCQEAGIPIVEFNDAKWAYPFSILKLATWMKKNRIQVVNTHSSRDGWIVGLAARLARVPLILRSRHIDVDYPNRFVSRIAFGKVPHAVLTTSERISMRLIDELNLDEKCVLCVPTGIDIEMFKPQVTGKLREELNYPPSTKLVGVVAVLRSWKGHHVLLDAAKNLSASHPDLKWVLAGDGPIRELLERRILDEGMNGYVHLLGHRTDVSNVMASLDIVVLPSTAHEGIPQTLLQAMAMGKPVIGTRVGGIPEIVKNGETGYLIPPQSADDLARAVDHLLKSPDWMREFGQKASDYVKHHHSVDHMIQQIEKIYQQFLLQPSGKMA